MSAPGQSRPIRGAQTFVGLMSVVWKRPALTATEVAWRWLVSAPLLLLAWHQLRMGLALNGAAIQANAASLSALSLFRPLEMIAGLRQFFAIVWPTLVPELKWFVPAFVCAWPIACAFGRTLWLRRYQPSLASRFPVFAVLMLLRLGKVAGLVALWFAGIALALRVTVIGPATRGEEANLVLCAAMIIIGTLLLFMLWSVTSWVVQLAPLVAVEMDVGILKSLTLAIRAPREVRSRLMEINLVMGIVKVGLLVLAMVLSACPLPFTNDQTEGFFTLWWIGTILLWLFMSDYFHVVRTVAYLRLWQAFDRTPTAESAS